MPTPLLDAKAAKVLAATNNAARLGNTSEMSGEQLISLLTACALDRTVRASMVELIYNSAEIADKSTEKLRKSLG